MNKKQIREPGYYWVMEKGTDDFIIGEWDGNLWWRVGTQVPYNENNFRKIGEKIENLQEQKDALIHHIINIGEAEGHYRHTGKGKELL